MHFGEAALQADDPGKACPLIGNGQQFPAVGARQMQLVLGYVDPDEHRRKS